MNNPYDNPLTRISRFACQANNFKAGDFKLPQPVTFIDNGLIPSQDDLHVPNQDQAPMLPVNPKIPFSVKYYNTVENNKSWAGGMKITFNNFIDSEWTDEIEKPKSYNEICKENDKKLPNVKLSQEDFDYMNMFEKEDQDE